MCGLAGFMGQFSGPGEQRETIDRMLHALVHRGPDDSGVWADADAGLVLGHRRLSIIDLSPRGRQPMVSSCGRYVLSFNGEIYNYRELRARLRLRHCEKDCGDTRVLLETVSAHGLRGALQLFNGMFALALWDRQERTLHLVRDRLGEKPLYYGWAGRSFVFGSELRALRAHPHWRNEIDRTALEMFLRYKYVPTPRSIYQRVRKLEPGALLSVPQCVGRSGGRRELPGSVRYWSARSVAARGQREPFAGSDAEGLEELEQRLQRSVQLRMVSDVPLGAFLSGGIDSATVVSIMQSQSRRPIKTFTIGFCEDEFNEAPAAAEVAAQLGTDHTELYVTPSAARDVIPLLPRIYDEPFADSSQLPTFLVAQLARHQVVVALSGDGGDELFAGYARYARARRAWSKLALIPWPLRRLAARLGTPLVNRYAARTKAELLTRALGASSDVHFYQQRVTQWPWSDRLVLNDGQTLDLPGLSDSPAQLSDLTHRMMFLDLVSYLPDDILTKVDRASMAVSLESRLPLLDHELVEFTWTLPLRFKVRDGQSKWLLRRQLERYLPARMLQRPKRGFGVPVNDWLQGPLRDWAEALLSAHRLRADGFLDADLVQHIWQAYLGGCRAYGELVWAILMFQAWLDAVRAERVELEGIARCA